MEPSGSPSTVASHGGSAGPATAQSPSPPIPGSSRITPPGCASGGSLLFTSERDGNRELYRICPDGTGSERLTTTTTDDHVAAVGPSGRIAVVSFAGHAGEPGYVESIQRLDLPHGLRALGPGSPRHRNPSWLPDGTGLLVESGRDDVSEILRLGMDGRLTPVVRERAGSYEPTVAPDGKTFVFVSSRDGDAELYQANLDGRQWMRLTFSRGDDSSPSFSPDGSQLAFLSTRLGAARVYVMNADGSKPRSLDAEDTVGETQLAWSPDGRALAYVVVRKATAELRVVRVEDGALLAEHKGPFRVETPTWSPDGRWLAFASNEDGDVELYVMPTDGRDVVRVTRSPGVDFLPRWLPPSNP
jgi:TolB protein